MAIYNALELNGVSWNELQFNQDFKWEILHDQLDHLKSMVFEIKQVFF